MGNEPIKISDVTRIRQQHERHAAAINMVQLAIHAVLIIEETLNAVTRTTGTAPPGSQPGDTQNSALLLQAVKEAIEPQSTSEDNK